MILTKIDLLDEVLDAHNSALGGDHDAYRNHTYRVANFCHALGVDAPEAQEKAAIAAAFHDLGIWTDRTFDYLVPSAKLAQEHLVGTGRLEWGPEIEAMILEHHKLTAAPPAPSALVETFRRADWIDVTFGARSFGLSRDVLRPIFDAFPDAGFHARLAKLSLDRFLRHPTSPLPMLRW